eukprot:scaffold78463_cov28-Tisochrysis_lutea.AAC.4
METRRETRCACRCRSMGAWVPRVISAARGGSRSCARQVAARHARRLACATPRSLAVRRCPLPGSVRSPRLALPPACARQSRARRSMQHPRPPQLLLHTGPSRRSHQHRCTSPCRLCSQPPIALHTCRRLHNTWCRYRAAGHERTPPHSDRLCHNSIRRDRSVRRRQTARRTAHRCRR